MRRIVFYVLICIFVLSGVSVARDRGKSMDGIDLPRGKWWRTPEVANELNISSDEQAKLDNLYYDKRNQMIDLKGNVKKERIELERIIENENFDESASMNQFQKVLYDYNRFPLNAIIISLKCEKYWAINDFYNSNQNTMNSGRSDFKEMKEEKRLKKEEIFK